MEYKLKNSGLLESGEKTVILTDLINMFKKGLVRERSISYDDKLSIITILLDDDEEYQILLNEEQKRKFEEGIKDPNLDKLRDLIKFDEEAKYRNKVVNEFERGIEPTEIRAINVYSKYLDNELLRAGAAFCLGTAIMASPLIPLGISTLVIASAIKDPAIWKFILAGFLDLAGITAAVLFIKDAITDGPLNLTNDMKYIINEIKVRLLKKKDLREYKEQLIKLSEQNNLDITKEPVYTANSELLKEANEVLELIKKLPEEERSKFGSIVKEIINDYKIRGTEIINYGDSNSLTIGFPSLVAEMKSKLLLQRREIENRLGITTDTPSMEETPSVDPFNSWSDDLTENGQYMTLPKKTLG